MNGRSLASLGNELLSCLSLICKETKQIPSPPFALFPSLQDCLFRSVEQRQAPVLCIRVLSTARLWIRVAIFVLDKE